MNPTPKTINIMRHLNKLRKPVGPTELGTKMGYNDTRYASGYTAPVLRRLVEYGYATKTGEGQYTLTTEGKQYYKKYYKQYNN